MVVSTKKPIIRFKRVADAFEEAWAVKSSQPCADAGGGGSTSGSDHWPSGSSSLSDMVNSFIEGVDGEREFPKEDDDLNDSGDNAADDDSEKKEQLRNLLGFNGDDDDTQFRRKIIGEIEIGFGNQIKGWRESGFRRQLMVHLRQRGYDAGLCKSRWEKTGRYPAGNYEYVDVVAGDGCRYIVEVFPASLFEVARPSERYTALLEEFPGVFVVKSESVKQIVRLMSAAMKKSLKSSDLQVAPWRRNGYLQARWFAPYKRTTNAAPTRVGGDDAGGLAAPAKSKKRSVVGFEDVGMNTMASTTSYDCGRELAKKGGIRVGLLSATLQRS